MDNPHVVILPFPAQGHIKPMLMLADLLSRAGFIISFVNTEQNHRRLLDHSDGAVFRRRCPGINFLSIPDGLPPDHPRSGLSLLDLLLSTSTACKPIFKDLIASMSHAPTCIIADGIMSFAVDVAAELGIPAISFRTYNATSTWTYFHLDKLIEEGEIPVVAESEEDLDRQISCVPGLENILRRRDLPSICKWPPQSPHMQFFIAQASKMRKASGLILNTFDELEAPMVSRLRSILPKVYTVGPLHSAAEDPTAPPHGSSSLLQIDQSCTGWLDSQPSRSVLYVSFGSVAVLTRGELVEIWHGLVNSKTRFLWAIRPDLISDGAVPEELRTEMGRIVGWAPQEEVLAHDAVGGFLTHCGWNSVLEGICAGKPMICRPMVAEQQVNGRCVSGMWGLGVDMNCFCDRLTVERAVRDLMEGRRDEILRSTAEIARLARDSVRDGGSSHGNLNKLIADIKTMHSKIYNTKS